MMKYLLSLLFVLLSYHTLSACSCSRVDSFCEAVGAVPSGNSLVFRAEVIRQFNYEPASTDQPALGLMELQLVEQYSGPNMEVDILSLIGFNGTSCSISFASFTPGDELIVFLPDADLSLNSAVEQDLGQPVRQGSFCQTFFLPIIDGQVLGKISPGVSQMPLTSFEEEFETCIDLEPNLREAIDNQDIFILPNPAISDFSLITSNINIDQVIIYNALGQVVFTRKEVLLNEANGNRFDISNLPVGLYTVGLFAGDQYAGLKLVVH